MQSSLGTYGCYWFFASVAACAGVMGATVLPETKDKTLAEVSEYFYFCCNFNKAGVTREDTQDASSDDDVNIEKNQNKC